ncbi:MAG TPA: GNAT family N-acetyltransferase [Micromonosporaceae bacterium]
MRPITDEEWPAFCRMLVHAFHEDAHQDVTDTERKIFEPERSLAIFDDDQVVATTGGFSRELSVPGATLPAAHVSLVAVLGTHRRRGLLTRMMHRQLRDLREIGREPVAVLWASEEPIYGRYGYGAASQQVNIQAATREVRVSPGDGTGRLRLTSPGEAVKDLAQVYESVWRHRPGFSSRQDPWWEYRLTDIERHRNGATERRCLVYETAGGVVGYALWRSRAQWDESGPNAEVTVEELVCPDPVGYAELWRFLFEIDLTRKLSARFLAVDEPLFSLVDAPRRLNRQLSNALFLRIVDVPAALAARRYAAPVDLVLDVTDDLLPENTGRWRLTGDASGARCEATGAPADISLGVRELGAVYLGGTSLGGLAAAGLVDGRPEAVVAASTGFGWPVAPLAPEVF